MPTVALYKQDGSQAGEFQLEETVFGIEPNEHIVTEAVNLQRAATRQGTHAVKTRSQVRGGGRKPWRQKGTGQARHGSIRSPLWVGGGVTFGPQPRKYGYNMPKKTRRIAIKSALSLKAQADSVLVLEELALDAPKTKEFVSVLDALNVNEKALVVLAEKDENVARSASNLQGVKVITVDQLNVLDLLMHDKLILTKDAAEEAGEVLA